MLPKADVRGSTILVRILRMKECLRAGRDVCEKLQESSKLELEFMPKARIRLAKEGHSKTEYSNISTVARQQQFTFLPTLTLCK